MPQHAYIVSTLDSFCRLQPRVAFLFLQVTSRIQRDVDERSTASFMEWSCGGTTLEAWTGYTDDWLTRNPDGVTGWAPRVRGGNSTVFEAMARAAYPDVEGGVPIKGVRSTGVFSEVNATDAADMWPVLYINPPNMDFVGTIWVPCRRGRRRSSSCWKPTAPR